MAAVIDMTSNEPVYVTSPAGAIRPDGVVAHPLDELLAGVAAFDWPGPMPMIGDIELDSRAVAPGDLSVALPGQNAHGARFAAQAVAAGAAAVLTDQAGLRWTADLTVPVAVAADPRAAMAVAASRLFGNPAAGMTMFGVTGTNGKTTTTFFLEAGLAACALRTGVIGTIGFRVAGRGLDSSRTTVTTPESTDLQAMLAVMAADGVDAVAMEVSSHALDLRRVAGITYDVAGFTNFGRDHLDYHHTLEAYFEAKARLFAPGASRVAVLNGDDPACRRIVDRARAVGTPRTVLVGFGADCQDRIVSWRPDGSGSAIELDFAGRRIALTISLPGEYNVRNAAMAVAMIDAAGLDAGAAAAGMAGTTVPGRMQPIDLGPGAPHVYVDFGHTPQAIQSALDAAPAPRVAVVGAGGDRDATKRAPMGDAAVRGAEIVVVTDDNPRTEDPAAIRAGVLAGALPVAAELGRRVVEVSPREAALEQALRLAGPGWSVVALGKGHETTQQIGTGARHFSDAEELRAAWGRLHGSPPLRGGDVA
jgi:UDP-N-acetylmuramoyl-L-alanyl-D-glutamate--2,6-diaminopimelate ligase